MFIKELLTVLSRSRLRYCVVGGVAMNLHGVPRMTYDVDIVVTPDRPTLIQLESLLDDFGLASRQSIRMVDLADPVVRERERMERNLIAVTFSDPSDPLREVDVLISPPVEAAALIGRAEEMHFGGLPVRVVSLDDLIALKRASSRAQDAVDVEHLERIRTSVDND